MTRIGTIAAFIFVLATNDIAARSHHRHYRHPYDPTFCRDIISAFDQLPMRDLDAFVKSVPEDKRRQALRCLTRIGR